MPVTVLVQIMGVVPPWRFGLRVLPPGNGEKGSPRLPGKVELSLSKNTGGCRTDQLLYDFSTARLKLVDAHLKYRVREGRETSVLTLAFSDAGRAFLPTAPTYEEWKAHKQPAPTDVSDLSAEDAETYWRGRFERWQAGLADNFRAWYEGILNHSWVAGRLYVNADIACINLVGSLRLQADDEAFAVSQFFTVKT